jgi:hypothetical protein
LSRSRFAGQRHRGGCHASQSSGDCVTHADSSSVGRENGPSIHGPDAADLKKRASRTFRTPERQNANGKGPVQAHLYESVHPGVYLTGSSTPLSRDQPFPANWDVSMSVYWGVNSWNRADQMPPIHVPARLWGPAGPPNPPTLFEFVKRRLGRAPEFWGRYLNQYSYGLTETEMRFLLGQKCRVALIYNEQRLPLTGPQAYRGGREASPRACRLARLLYVPRGVWIYADLENWSVDPDWFRGWCEFMYTQPYGGMGGAYGDAFHSWSWGASAAAATDDQQGSSLFRELAAGRIRPVSKASTSYAWSTRPHLGQGSDPPPGDIVPASFRGRGPVSFLIETVLWQYRTNVPLGTGLPLVDLDLATGAGYNSMWS